jgi:hypothetical protein
MRIRRRRWLLLTLAAAACRQAGMPPNLLPETVADVWHRTSLDNPAVSDAPDPVPRSAVNHFQTASYEGPGKVRVRVYDLESPAVALELVQRWRPSADTVFFQRGRYFVVLKWEDADRKALEALVAELEKRLGKPEN